MERLDNLRALIQEPDFLAGKGLSNEVNIRIFCYCSKKSYIVHFVYLLFLYFLDFPFLGLPLRPLICEYA